MGDGLTRHALSWGHLQGRKPSLPLSCCGTASGQRGFTGGDVLACTAAGSFALSLLDTTAPGVDGVIPSMQDVLSKGQYFL